MDVSEQGSWPCFPLSCVSQPHSTTIPGRTDRSPQPSASVHRAVQLRDGASLLDRPSPQRGPVSAPRAHVLIGLHSPDPLLGEAPGQRCLGRREEMIFFLIIFR